MSNIDYIVAGLAMSCCLMLIGTYFYAKSLAPVLGRRDLGSLVTGLGVFVVHALIFFEGTILFLALATYATIFAVFWIVAVRVQTNKSA